MQKRQAAHDQVKGNGAPEQSAPAEYTIGNDSADHGTKQRRETDWDVEQPRPLGALGRWEEMQCATHNG